MDTGSSDHALSYIRADCLGGLAAMFERLKIDRAVFRQAIHLAA